MCEELSITNMSTEIIFISRGVERMNATRHYEPMQSYYIDTIHTLLTKGCRFGTL